MKISIRGERALVLAGAMAAALSGPLVIKAVDYFLDSSRGVSRDVGGGTACSPDAITVDPASDTAQGEVFIGVEKSGNICNFVK